MTRRSPEAFPLDDQRVYDGYIQGRISAAMAVGVRLGLFDLLDEEPLTEPELVERLGLAPRGARALCAALGAYGVLARDGERWGLADDAAAYLVRGKPGSLWGLVDMEVEHFLSPAALLEAVRTGRPSVYGEADPWETHEADPESARIFTAAMHSVSARPAAGFAEVAPLDGVQRMLDVGGGSGALSIAAVRANSGLSATVLDLPSVCELAREYAREAGLRDRIDAVSGDMFGEPFPSGYDAVLLSQILHDWPPDRGRALLQSAYDALPPGGLVVVHEKFVNEADSAPMANVLVHLDMLVWTEGQQLRPSELERTLTEIGFRGFELRASSGYWSVASARKPTA